MPITAYTHQVSEKNYVFVLNSIWRKSHSTNINRLTFIEACKSCAGLNFEGGFAPRQNKDVKGFDAHTTERRYSIKEYISKTKRSAIVFNTPAVLDCHGWKLAEFLALGKAIITTPLSRALPAPLNDKKHFCEVNNLKDYHTIIDTLLNDFEFKEMLEKNARDYYEKYLKPSQTIAQLMSKFE